MKETREIAATIWAQGLTESTPDFAEADRNISQKPTAIQNRAPL
jgi:hypothetical protein